MENCLENPLEKKGLSADALKMIAIGAMLIDHIGLLVSTDYFHPVAGMMHFIGRTTGPLMFFFVVEGYYNTRNVGRYTMRLAIFALISYFPYMLFINNGLPTTPFGWLHFNVIYTLLLGLLAVRARHEVKNKVLSVCLVALCIVASVYGDWIYRGVIAILLFDLLRGNLTNQRIGFCLLALMFNLMAPLSDIMWGIDMDIAGRNLSRVAVRLGHMVPMVLLGFYNGQRGKGGGKGHKWLFYIFYPVHLLIFFFIAQWMGITIEM